MTSDYALEDGDLERLKELAASDRESAPIYQWYLERLQEENDE